MTVSLRLGGFALLVAAAATLLHGAAPPPVRFVTCKEARAVLLNTAATTDLPRGENGLVQCAALDAWMRQRDAAVRARVAKGEDEALVPLLLFGTSYTAAPRLTRDFFESAHRAAAADGSGQAGVERAFTRAFEQRTDDLLRGMAAPGDNVRLQWARDTLLRHGHRFDSPAARAVAGQFLVETFARVTRDSEQIERRLATTGAEPDSAARRARAFAQRGLAPDTSWPIGFAVDRALAALRDRGDIAPASVRHVVVVGPGLDVLDKDEGFDRHPPQSLQPFAVIDSALALGLGEAPSLHVTTLDVNPRVTAHLSNLKGRAQGPTLHLTRDEKRSWTADAVNYWQGAVTRLGQPTQVPGAPSGGLVTRSVALDARWPARVTALDANIVYQRLDLPATDRADLVVATNVLLYYDGPEQALAAANIAHMLRPGGVLLTNTRLDAPLDTTPQPGANLRTPVTPASVAGLRALTDVLVVFSDRPGDGERMFPYRKP